MAKFKLEWWHIVIGIAVILVLSNRSSPQATWLDTPEWGCSNYAEHGSYENTGVWISADCNLDGTNEAYGTDANPFFPSIHVATGVTPEGIDYKCHFPTGLPTEVWVYLTPATSATHEAVKFLQNEGASSSADLACSACGDNVCDGRETCSSCPADCGACPAVCGNGVCEVGEGYSNCPADCDTSGGTDDPGDGTILGIDTTYLLIGFGVLVVILLIMKKR